MTPPDDGAVKPTKEKASPKAATENIPEIEVDLEDIFPDTESLFSPYVVPSSSDETVIVAIDTNALLLPYNIGKDDLSALAEVYRQLSEEKRLYIPARCVREFIKHRDRKLAELIHGLNNKISRIGIVEDALSPLLKDADGYRDLEKAVSDMQIARASYSKAYKNILDQIKSWRGNDPVTSVYKGVFFGARVVEHDGKKEEVKKDWQRRLLNKIPPGYKDSGKGDFIIWKTLLRLGNEHKKDLVFVTGEQKADWFVNSGGEAIYPRPELVDEYRRASGGRNIRLSTLYELLREMRAPASVVNEVQRVEDQANTAIRVASEFMLEMNVEPDEVVGVFTGIGLPFARGVIKMDYSGDTAITVTDGQISVLLHFLKGTGQTFLRRSRSLRGIGHVKDAQPGDSIEANLNKVTSLVSLKKGDVFIAENQKADILVGRILNIEDKPYGTEFLEFSYNLFRPGQTIIAP